MKRIKFIVLVVVVLTALLYVGYLYFFSATVQAPGEPLESPSLFQGPSGPPSGIKGPTGPPPSS